MRRGLFITLEGLDGSGKTTQINRLAAWLKMPAAPASSGAQPSALSLQGEMVSEVRDCREIVLTRQPGGTPIGDRIRTLALDSRTTALAPLAEMALMFADRAQAIAEVIEPALAAGKIVLCDRFTDSTEAYQGGGRALSSETVLELHRLLCSNLQPDLTLLLLPPLESALNRARRRNQRTQAQAEVHLNPCATSDEGRFEAEKDAFFHRVHQKYLEIAARDPARIVLIQGDFGIEEVHKKIVQAVTELLRAHFVESFA